MRLALLGEPRMYTRMTETAGSELRDRSVSFGVGDVGDYVALLKPRVMSLAIFTALAGMIAAPVSLNPILAVASILAIALGAGASGALNMWFDADIDAKMMRTKRRPIPAGRVDSEEVLMFGGALSGISVLILALASNYLAAFLLAFSIAFYVLVYTMWLKRSTPQNIVIGGLAGALPPAIGWTAATGQLTLEPIVLVAIIFLWTPPHFWALSLYKRGDYSAAGIPMLPNVKGDLVTRRQIWIYSLVLVPVTLAPAPLGFGGPVYLAVAAIGGAVFLHRAYAVFKDRDASNRAAKRLFAFSILHLFSLFAALIVEKLAGF